MKRAAAVLLLGLVALPFPARADAPAAEAFTKAWVDVDNYTATITVHETDGKSVQDRVYHYAYKKPHFAKIDIVSGPGRGGGASWTGGDQVRGHQGGFLSGIKLTVAITDGRATSLRGDTIDRASFQATADLYKVSKPEPAPSITIDGATVEGAAAVLPLGPGGATRSVVYFSGVTHLPVRRVTYAGDQLVKQEDFSDVKLNPGLTEGDF